MLKYGNTIRSTGVVKTLALFNDVTHSLVGLFAAAPWVLCAFNGIEVSVERDFLRSHLDKNGGCIPSSGSQVLARTRVSRD
jgi:hypothetical protein